MRWKVFLLLFSCNLSVSVHRYFILALIKLLPLIILSIALRVLILGIHHEKWSHPCSCLLRGRFLASRRRGFLRPRHAIAPLASGTLQPTIRQGDVTRWCHTSPAYLSKTLESIQKRAFNIIFLGLPYNVALSRSGLLPLSQRREKSLLARPARIETWWMTAYLANNSLHSFKYLSVLTTTSEIIPTLYLVFNVWKDKQSRTTCGSCCKIPLIIWTKTCTISQDSNTICIEQALVSVGIASVSMEARPCDSEHCPKIRTTYTHSSNIRGFSQRVAQKTFCFAYFVHFNVRSKKGFNGKLALSVKTESSRMIYLWAAKKI